MTSAGSAVISWFGAFAALFYGSGPGWGQTELAPHIPLLTAASGLGFASAAAAVAANAGPR